MNLLFGHDRDVAHWVACQIPHMHRRIPRFAPGEAFGPGAAIGVLDAQGRMVGGCVYHNWDEDCGSMEISCASTTPSWLKPGVMRALLRYPFAQVGCQRLTACTPRRATSARQFLERLGFKREGCVRRGFGDDHAIIYGLLAEEWAESSLNRPARQQRLIRGQEDRAYSAASA